MIDDRYALERVLSEGGQGTVYAARQLRLGTRRVAIKILRESRVGRTAKARFRREAALVARLHHPNTIRVFDAGELPSGLMYIVMELLQGESLQDRLDRDRRLSEHQTLLITRQIAGAMSEAHAAGIIHRDLKPANIFLESFAGGMFARVLDFGVALPSDEPRLTERGVPCGTLGYMSLEQLMGEEMDARADIFSLGAIAYRALSGHDAFPGRQAIEHITHVMTGKITPLSNHIRVRPELESLIHAMLAKDPRDRPSSMLAVDAELGSILWTARNESEQHTMPNRVDSCDTLPP